MTKPLTSWPLDFQVLVFEVGDLRPSFCLNLGCMVHGLCGIISCVTSMLIVLCSCCGSANHEPNKHIGTEILFLPDAPLTSLCCVFDTAVTTAASDHDGVDGNGTDGDVVDDEIDEDDGEGEDCGHDDDDEDDDDSSSS